MTGSYETLRRVVYGEGACFVPVCHKCGRFVIARSQIIFDGQGQPHGWTARCKKCGKTEMLFEGYV